MVCFLLFHLEEEDQINNLQNFFYLNYYLFIEVKFFKIYIHNQVHYIQHYHFHPHMYNYNFIKYLFAIINYFDFFFIICFKSDHVFRNFTYFIKNLIINLILLMVIIMKIMIIIIVQMKSYLNQGIFNCFNGCYLVLEIFDVFYNIYRHYIYWFVCYSQYIFIVYHDLWYKNFAFLFIYFI